MKTGLSSLRKNRLLPIAAVISSILLLTGESLNCCRLNQSLSQTLQKWITVAQNHPITVQDDDSDHESHCHRHSNLIAHTGSHESDRIVSASAGDGAGLDTPNTCISENSLAAKAMLQGEFAMVDLLTLFPAPQFTFVAVAPFLPERPRPQNRSSPPLYLTTLRILV